MRFLLDADDDWIEVVRRWLFPRLHGVASRFGAYTIGTTGENQRVCRVLVDEETIETVLVALGFERNPIACFKSLVDGRESEGSWVLRSHDDRFGLLERDRQLHVTLFLPRYGHGVLVYAHEEYDWQDAPRKHFLGESVDPIIGATKMLYLLMEQTDLKLQL